MADQPQPDRADAAREALGRARAAARERGGTTGSGSSSSRAPARGASSGSTRDPLLLGEAIQRLLDEQGWRGNAAVAGVLGRWAEIVGAEVAAHVVPDSFDLESGTLVLRADSTAWASVIRMQVATVADRVAEQVGAGVVRTVRVLGPAAPSWRHGPRSVKGRGPRDTYG